MNTTTKNPYLHTPASVTRSYVQWAERLKTEPGITFGCVLDQFIIPPHPGEMVAVIARPGHGKTSWMAQIALREAERIMKSGDKDEIVVFVSWEQPVEEIEAFFQSARSGYSSTDMAWGRLGMDVVRQGAISRAELPIWTIGTSIETANQPKKPMYIDDVLQTIEDIHATYGKRVTMAVFDYIQIIPIKGKSSRMEQVGEAALQVKRTAMQIGAPVFVGVQASRDVDSYGKAQIPTMKDAQWASTIEQAADKVFAIWRPIRSLLPSEEPYISIGGKQYENNESLFVIRLLKQRLERGFGVWAVHFDPGTLALHDYQTIEL
jgi:replicative DNA helicase